MGNLISLPFAALLRWIYGLTGPTVCPLSCSQWSSSW